jgi:uncharacterized protein (DUF1330 family)
LLDAEIGRPLYAFVVAIESVHDVETFTKEHGPKVPATLQPYGGRYLVRGGKPTNLEGDAPGRFVIIEFDSLQNAQQWYQSPEFQKPDPSEGIKVCAVHRGRKVEAGRASDEVGRLMPSGRARSKQHKYQLEVPDVRPTPGRTTRPLACPWLHT